MRRKDDAAKAKDSPLTRKVKYGQFNIRLIATMIDMTIIMSVGYPLCQWVDAHLFPPLNINEFLAVYQNPLPAAEFKAEMWKAVANQHLIGRTIVTNLLQFILFAIYILPCWIKYDNTPGKMMTGLQIRDAKTNEPMTTRQKIIRFLAYVPAGAPFAIGFIWVLFNKKRQGWHDKIAGTVVVVKEKQPFALKLKSSSL